MTFSIDKIFIPSMGVDLVFDMDSATPVSRSSIIYDTNHKNKTITIAQPIVTVTKATEFEQLHLTTIVHGKQRKARVGIKCKPVKFIENYPLTNKTFTKALVLRYSPPALETNIRSAFRLPLSNRHTVKGKLLYNDRDYLTTKNFKIKDLSFAGLGIVVGKKQPPSDLMGLKKGCRLKMGISLIDSKQDSPLGTFPVKIKVARINPNYSDTHALIGFHIESISPQNEDLLIKFIHDAQIVELKRLSQKG